VTLARTITLIRHADESQHPFSQASLGYAWLARWNKRCAEWILTFVRMTTVERWGRILRQSEGLNL
jgi:hypothetical protein